MPEGSGRAGCRARLQGEVRGEVGPAGCMQGWAGGVGQGRQAGRLAGCSTACQGTRRTAAPCATLVHAAPGALSRRQLGVAPP